MENFSLSLTTKNELLERINTLLASEPSKKYYVTITDRPKKRSLSANAQQHVWYKQISEFTCTDVKTVEAECKIDFGLPIILSDEKYGKVIDYALTNAGFYKMSREQQIKFIQIIQVTSLMNTKQHNQYRDNILYFWNQAGLNIGYEQG